MTSPNTLSDAVRNAVIYNLCNIDTAFPGQIVSYDPVLRKASIQPTVNRKYSDGTVQPMPILNSVPVMMPFSGGASITFPISVGDTCLVVCCERSITEWLNQGIQVTPNDPRIFSLADAVAIMGLLPFTVTNPNTSNDEFVIGYNGSQIVIRNNGDIIIETANKVAIGNSTAEVLDIIERILGILSTSLTEEPGDIIQQSPLPPNGDSYTSLMTLISNLKATI